VSTSRSPVPASPGLQPRVGWVLYDADCSVCTRLARTWSGTLGRLGLGVAPLQSPWVSERTGLDRAALLQDLRLLENNGRLVSGPDVYRYVMRRLWWGYPLFLLSTVPGLSRIFDWSYRTFARHRSRLPGGCGLPLT
jgi:predicted DCC family thiol-disulfide oxidoreductase YuxK